MSDWKQDLDALFRARGEVPRPSTTDLLVRRNHEAGDFIDQTVVPAFEELREALGRYGREALLSTKPKDRGAKDRGAAASIRVRNEGRDEGRDEFEYLIGVRVTPERAFPYVELVPHPGLPGRASEGTIRDGAQDYSVTDITKEEIIRHFVSSYAAHLTP
jgi:hypothetical protein